MEQKQETEESAKSPAAVEEEQVDEVIDIEEYAKLGKKVPKAKGYKIRVNGNPITVDHPIVTGRQVLELAGLIPPGNYTLRLKAAGQQPRKIALDEKVDLRGPGVEKFKALPRDQTEG